MVMRKKERKTDFSEKYIRWFSQLNNKDVAIAGGKGASLSEMYNNKFPVPPGFIVTSKAFDFFLEKEKLKPTIAEILSVVDLEDTEALENASKKIREIMESKEFPKELEEEIIEAYHFLSSDGVDESEISQDALTILKNAQEPIFVSVRSSATTEDLATASFAGQQDSFLNIKGSDSLIEHVKKCFSSLYTPRAIYYRNKKGFKEGESLLAVVVQKMVDSEKSGVVFSRNPLDLSEDIVIETVFGLGEGLVSGRIHPDNHVVSRDLKIKKTKVSDKKIAVVRRSSGKNAIVDLSPTKSKAQVLTNGEILELADYAIKLENHYKKPQDIEFAIEEKKVYIVQSRPITTLDAKQQIEEIVGKPILEGLGASPGVGVGVARIIDSTSELSKIKKGDVMVTKMTNPDMVISMQKSVAIVTDEGGMTSHASIVSREMGIPCIVGTRKATSVLKDGMKITVDGSTGRIFEGEVAKTSQVEIKPAVKTHKVKIKVIVDLPEFAERAVESEVEHIGLTRIEGMITESGKHPLLFEKQEKLHEYTEILKKGIKKIIEPFQSIWIRASDIRTDEFSTLEGAPEKEINPMLGLHGIRFSLKHPKILEAELLAIKQVAEKNTHKKFGIMFPQIISIEEVRQAKQYFDKIKTHNMEFGVMIETPASVQIIDDICPEVDFVSFGTNDLTQYTLAVDRGEDLVQHLYDEIHPAVFSQIEKVIDACKRSKTESSICGQAGSNKEMVEFLVKKGIDSISVNADAAYEISSLIKELESGREEEREYEDKGPEEKLDNLEEQRVEKKAEPQVSEVNEDFKIPEEDWKRLTRKEKRKFLRKLRKKKKQMERKQAMGDSLEEREIGEQSLSEDRDIERDNMEDKSQLPHLPKKEFIDREDVEDIKEDYEDKLLENIQIPAEIEEEREIPKTPELQENIGAIKPFDNLNRIEDKTEEIKQDVEESKLEQMQENREVEENIEAERFDSESNLDRIEQPSTNNINQEREEPSLGENKDIEKNISDIKQESEREETSTNIEEENARETEEQDLSENKDIDTGISSEPSSPESIGVYNPNEEEDNSPQKMEYRFDDDEDIYSDVF